MDDAGQFPPSGRLSFTRMVERSNFTDHLADLEKAAGIKLGMPSLHGFHMLGMRAPGFQRLFGSETENGYFLAIVGLEGLNRLKAGKTADDIVHAFAQPVVFVLRGALAQLQVSDNEHFVDHSLPLV